ncbi:MAG TPA: TAXI family TRAP transporter solute-binding subunit [Alphaproteobacteria bacterium]|nr:TAXI family TRAP transporter solute-binding subunit [Alphaproteobacteria bacterium]
MRGAIHLVRLCSLPVRRCIFAALAVVLAVSALAQGSQFFRIGTGSTGGTYFPIGAILASAISNPPGSRECERGGSCGVPGLIAVAQSTTGSVENVRAIGEGLLESALSQADVAFWAYHGRHTFAQTGPIKNLRAIANLYPEMIHIVVRRDSGILTVRDLKGKRVSLDREGSGTLLDAMLILETYGIKLEDLTVEHLESGPAADRLREGMLDAFFFVAGVPAAAVTDLAASVPISLVPISGPDSDRLRQTYPFFSANYIPAGSYPGIYSTPTVSVGAQWLVAAGVSEETVYGVARALWHPSTERLLDAGHPQGKHIRRETALVGLGIPLHPGAVRFYREVGLLP